jgi:formylglycine-generating enzyme required for sulfatase activity
MLVLLGVLILLFGSCGDEAVVIPAWARVAPEQIAEAQRLGVPIAFENDLGMRFVLIPAGEFQMGAPLDEEGRQWDEVPRKVTIAQAYYIQITEVTNDQFRSFRPAHSSGATGRTWSLDGANQPVVYVSHEDARAFAEWLSGARAAFQYRLPTESEWERAARAGSDTQFFWGSSVTEAHVYANLLDVSPVRAFARPWTRFTVDDGYRVSAPVGSYEPNSYGLYDMTGNVWEWCGGHYRPTPSSRLRDSRVARGGSWMSGPQGARVAERIDAEGVDEADDLGFRLVLEIATPATDGQ